MSGTVPGPVDTAVSKTDKNPCPGRASYILLQEAICNVADMLLGDDYHHGEK